MLEKWVEKVQTVEAKGRERGVWRAKKPQRSRSAPGTAKLKQ
jgi:hypothetical protein